MSAAFADLAQHPLSRAQMLEAMERIMTGQVAPEELAAFLQALAARGETAEEIAGAVQALRRQAVPLPLSQPRELCDTCGTGGDRQGTFNISTLAALTAAACGVRVSKHGNRAASSRCGSADVLEALGLNLNATPAQVARSIEEIGFGFCFAPKFHPAMKAVAEVRKTLGIRTIFNLVGPLANPAPLAFQLVGVPDERLMQPVAEALQALGVRHGMVVHGLDGLDEATTTEQTIFLEVSGRSIESGRLRPEELGYSRATVEALRGGDAQDNARLAREVLGGRPSPRREIVALNAGCAIYVADQARSIPEGVAKAEAALESGRVLALLDRVIAFSNQP
ncbi:MAG: anthranilate phosphoribosyltransferase [Candidatus Omnitrophica bacterium]|nr:anthranilate phosphoribosyltransferase [Candidatus Omnitrophota bacterium]